MNNRTPIQAFISDELRTALKVQLAKEDKTITEVVTELIEKYLQTHKS